jgi:predicted RNA-binding protein with TRAM domain
MNASTSESSSAASAWPWPCPPQPAHDPLLESAAPARAPARRGRPTCRPGDSGPTSSPALLVALTIVNRPQESDHRRRRQDHGYVVFVKGAPVPGQAVNVATRIGAAASHGEVTTDPVTAAPAPVHAVRDDSVAGPTPPRSPRRAPEAAAPASKRSRNPPAEAPFAERPVVVPAAAPRRCPAPFVVPAPAPAVAPPNRRTRCGTPRRVAAPAAP